MNDLGNGFIAGFIIGFDSIAARLGMTLIHSLWQGSAVAVLLLAVLRLADRAASTVRYALCCGAMTLFVAICIGTFADMAPPDGPVSPMPAAVSVIPTRLPVVGPSRVYSGPQRTVSKTNPMQLIAVTWLLGVTSVALWHIGGWLFIHRLRRGKSLDGGEMLRQLCRQLGLPRVVRLIECARLEVPAVMGVLSPVVLIPLGFFNDLPPEQLRAILAHELAHIRRHDYLINLFQAAIESLLFYHPATWWISAQIRREREHCCDDIAASIAEPRLYASALLALEEHLAPRAFGLLAATDGSLLRRVQRLLNPQNGGSSRPVRSILAGIIVLACVGVPLFLVWHRKPVDLSVHSSTSSVVAGSRVSASGILDEDLKPFALSKRIEAGDLVHVAIGELTGLGVTTENDYKVSDPQGTIDLPYVGELKIAGLDESDVAKVISKAYRVAQIIPHAQVGFLRKDARGLRFVILGQADRPGEYPISQMGFRLCNALAMAGAHPAEDQTIVIARKTDGGTTRTLMIPAKQLMAGDDHLNVVVHPGDIILLPSAETAQAGALVEKNTRMAEDNGKYYIGGGEVQRAGVYSIPAGMITLKQAIIAAGGFNTTNLAGTVVGGYIRVIRRHGESEAVLLDNAKGDDLLSGKQEDLLLHANDTIMVNPVPLEWHGATTEQALKQ